ncbi:tRNA dihydrouridine synthase [Mediterraneibacter glycyrrhizinilyticus]|uniref:tRNA dihydrouridine synthase n=1 Tax=Mediterraneibacter glycyrrhizinilyticus TaxID=342942 RepID=UPI0025AA49D0|nr:tRNA-dihydrouridine synthase family protein [Mediterraneibacter glycyrrhizinilyticus]MDN0044358.1 tRNA-dihydrouridine synthase family protein [Mediterraneibacter glycyrrhizinilyticus]
MRLYLAPLEGITGWIFRSALYKCFGGFDKYFVPFIRPNQMGHFSAREKKDILPAHNEGMYTVPQILTNKPEDFIRTAAKLKEYGYEEINLNLGCPSKTVVTKGRGAGFLAYPDRLDAFLDEIFEKCDIRISIKTRLGMEEPEEFYDLMEIYNKYPMEELIIHPRVQKDFYKNTANLELFSEILPESRNPVCYNGDIFTPDDYERFVNLQPSVERIMTGRGVLADPALARRIRGGSAAGKEELRRFHELLYAGYCEEMSGERTILYKMKELWTYLAPGFTNYKKYAKKIKKAEKCPVYEKVVEELFENEEISAS